MNGYGMGLGWLIPILFIVGLVYLLNNNGHKKDKSELSAKEILDIRLAKGEIDKEEYEERLKALNL
jgi:putative membrane protein